MIRPAICGELKFLLPRPGKEANSLLTSATKACGRFRTDGWLRLLRRGESSPAVKNIDE